MMITCAILFFKIPPRMTKLLAGHEYVFFEAYAQSLRADWDRDL